MSTDRLTDSNSARDSHPPLSPQIAVDNQTLPNPGATVQRNIQVDGQTREYTIHTPANWDGKTPLPVMYFLNGLSPGGDPNDTFTGLQQEADKDGFMLVDLKGSGPMHSWNNGQGVFRGSNPNESDFLNAVHGTLQSEAPLDESHQGLVGFSNGGSEAFALASSNNWVSSVQSVEGYMTGKEQPLNHAVSAQIINGNDDSIVPIGGTPSVDAQAVAANALNLLGPVGWFTNAGIGAIQGAEQTQGSFWNKLEGAAVGIATRFANSTIAPILENFGVVNGESNYIEPQNYAVNAFATADRTGAAQVIHQNGDTIENYVNTTSGATVRAVQLGTGGHSWAEEADHSEDLPGISDPNTTYPATQQIGAFFMQHAAGH